MVRNACKKRWVKDKMIPGNGTDNAGGSLYLWDQRKMEMVSTGSSSE